MADYRVDIDVKVNDKELDNLESRIEKLNSNDPVKVKAILDDSKLQANLKGNTKNQTVKFSADSSDINKVLVAVNTSLKQASKAGKIKLDFDDNGAIKGINSIQQTLNKNGEVIKLRVEGVDAAGNAFTAIQDLRDEANKPIDIQINYKNLEQTKTVFKQTEADYKELLKLIDDAGKKKVELFGLKEGSESAKVLNAELEKMDARANKILSRSLDNFSNEQFKGIADAESTSNYKLEKSIAGAIDKYGLEQARAGIKQTEADYKELLATMRDIGKIKVQLTGLDESSAEAKALTAELQRLEKQAEEISTRSFDNFNKKQINGINSVDTKNAFNLAQAQGKLVDKQSAQEAKAVVSQTNAEYKELIATMREIGSTRVQLQGLDVGSKQAEKLTADLEQLKAKAQGIFDSNTFNTSQMTGIDNMTAKIDSDLDNAKNKIVDARAEAAKGIKLHVDNGGLDADFGNIKKQMLSLDTYANRVQKEYGDVVQAARELEAALKAGDPSKIISANESYANSLDKLENKMKRVSATQKKVVAEQKNQIAQQQLRESANNLSLSMDVWLKNNSAAAKEFGSRIKMLQAELKTCDSVRLTGIQSEFKALTTEATLAGKTGLNFVDKLKMQFSRLGAYFGASGVIMSSIQAVRKMSQNVLEIDTAMTELKRVTDLTDNQYSDLYDNMVSSAKEYGATLSDIISSTADWSRAGFDANTANKLSEITMMYEHIADIDYDEASKNLLTTYKGFEGQLNSVYGDTETSVSHITDVLNELDNNYSVTAAGVGEALRRSAASMDVANNTFEQTAALVTGAVEVTQDPEGAGNALKVVSMRLRGAKGELEDLGEEVDDNVTNLTKMQGQILNLTHGKVNIFEDNGDFKSTYEILKGIHDVWDDLSDIEQADLLENVAGKHRANTVASILANWDDVEKAYTSTLNATGSAAKENAKYMDSLQGRLNNLTTAFQSLSNSVMSSNFLKGIVDVGSGALNLLDSLIDKFGTFKTLLAGISAALTIKGMGGMFKVVEDEENMSGHRIASIFSDVKKAFSKNNSTKIFDNTFNDRINADVFALNEYKLAVENGANAGDAFVMKMGEASSSAKEYAESTEASAISSKLFVANERQKQVALKASNSTLSNCSSLIQAYSDANERGGMSQTQFAGAVGQGNKHLGKYLSGLNGAKGSIGGYIVSLVGAKVATAALQVVTMALNAALTMGISFAISAIVTAIMSWINASDELAESVDDATSKYKEQHGELTKNKTAFEDLAKSYAKLSKGVDSTTGKNISLMPDEYKEYQDVVNKIADQIPSLVAGYDEQGNAILNCAGDVDTLTEAYNKLIIAQNNELLNGDGKDYKGLSDLADDFQNDYKKIKKDNNTDALDSMGEIEKIFNLPSKKEVEDYLTDDYQMYHSVVNNLKQKLESEGKTDIKAPEGTFVDTKDYKKYILDVYEKYPEAIRSTVDKMNKEIDEASQQTKEAMSAYMENAFLRNDYSNISKKMQSVAQNIVSGLDGNAIKSIIGDKTGDDAKRAITDWIDNLLGTLDKLDTGAKKKLESAFDLKDSFSKGDVAFGEYKTQLEKVSKLIDGLGLDDNTKKQLKLSLNIDDVTEQYNTLIKRLTDMGVKDAKKLVKGLSSSELTAVQKLISDSSIDLAGKSIGDIKKEIQKLARYIEAESFTIDIEAETDGIDKLNSALAEARSGTGLTAESFEALKSRYSSVDGYNQAKLFQETANGLSLNAEAVNEYEKALTKTKLDETSKNIGALKDKYYELTNQIQNCSDATKRAELISEQEDVRKKINDLAELATMYEGLTSSYNEWQNAESAGNNRDMYESVYSAQENIKKELKNGWIDNGTKEYFQLIWGEDKWDGAGKSVQDYRDQWAKLDETISGTSYSISDFFKTNSDGELTSEGIFNFFDAVGQKQKELGTDWIQYDENGNMKSFNFGVDGDKAIADAMGISEELVQIFLRASQDAGFVVNFDGTYTQLADMQSQADAAAAKLKEIGKTNVDFDFNTKDISSLNSQLEEARKILADPSFWNQDGTFNFNVEGATEAMQVVSTLQATIDSLGNHYIGLTVEDGSFKEPLKKLQDYESKVATLNQLKLDPQTNAKDIEKLEADIKDIVQYVRDHAEDLKLEITPETTDEDITNMIESGQIEIPTTLDIQTNMSETLDDLKDIMLLTSGYLTEDQEYDLRVKLNLVTDEEKAKKEAEKLAKDTKDIMDKAKANIAKEGWTLTDEQDSRSTKFFENNEYARKYDEDEYTRTVKFVGDWSDIDEGKNKYTDSQIKAVVEFVKDSTELDKYMNDPLKKQAVVDFVVENQNILDELNLDKEHKDIVIDFVANNPDFLDGLDNSEKKVAIDFVANNPGFFDEFEGEDKKFAIDFVAKNPELLDGLSEDDKKVNVEYVVKNKDLLNELAPNKKKIVVDFMVKNKDFFETLGEDGKKIAIDFMVKNEDIFKELDEDKREIAIKYFVDNPDALAEFQNLSSDEQHLRIQAIVSGEASIDQMSEDLSQLDDKQVQVIAQTLGNIDVEQLKTSIGQLDDRTVKAIATALGEGDVQGLQNAINGIPNQKVAQAIAEAFGYDSVEQLNGAIDGLDGRFVQAVAQALGITDVESLRNTVNSLDGNTVEAIATALGEGDVLSLKSSVDSLKDKTITIATNFIGGIADFLLGGGGGVDGTAHVNGTAFANGTTGRAFKQGDWGTKEDGVALGGELGEELLVRNGRWYTIGENGAEFFGYKKDDIIFNADQTKELFEKGKITHGNGRGKALAEGTAFSNGSGSKRPSYSSSSSSSYSSSSSGSSSSSSSSSSSDKEEDKFEETLDWIETKIDRIERAISRLEKTASSTYKTWTKRNTALNDQISKTREEIDIQQRAYDRYIAQANKVGLAESYAAKVRDGTIDIETITDEDLNDKISEYKEW